MKVKSAVLRGVQKAAVLLALYASWIVPGCVAMRAGTEEVGADSVWIEVENQHYATVNVFWVGHGSPMRLGRVNSLEKKRLRVPTVWTYSGPVRLAISPVGSTDRIALPPLAISDGTQIRLTIANALQQSTLLAAR